MRPWAMPDDARSLEPSRSWRLRCSELDRRCVQRCNRVLLRRGMPLLLGAVSRLGDGWLWYGLIAVLPLVAGARGWQCARLMLLAGVIDLALYWILKRGTARERPHFACPDLRLCTPSLDRYSFPSGHTLHAVAFTTIVLAHFPYAALALVPFTLLTAYARVALGLHYPSDILVGASIGGAVAWALLDIAL
jgi:undecaprenyl-diphosphatase